MSDFSFKPVEGLLTVYGYNEVGTQTALEYQIIGVDVARRGYTFDAPGNLAIMDPGVPYGRYYAHEVHPFDIQKNRVLNPFEEILLVS